MKHPFSPIRHDYKPSPTKKAEKKNILIWFIAGLGLPLLAIPLYPILNPLPSNDIVTNDQELAIAMEIKENPAISEPQQTIKANSSDKSREKLDVTLSKISHENSNFHPPLALPPSHDHLTLEIKSGDSLDRIFKRYNLNLSDLAVMLDLPEASPYLKKVIPGDELTIEHDDGDLISLYREINLTTAIKIKKHLSGFVTEIVQRPLEIRRKAAYGTIGTSLFESAAQIGLSDKTVMNLAGIFAWDIDFVLDIRLKDSYYVLFEQIYQNGEYISDGEIVAAEFNNNGRTIQAIRYIDQEGRSDYFSPDGHSLRKAFIRAPVDFTRISSNFNPRRKHPILNTIRAHRGVDYAAPRGTPVKAAGDGKIIFRGNKNGYGQTIILQHGSNITTLYAHLNSFDKNALMGHRVIQGQTVGYVGMTGLATAPHLHYEYRLNGVHRNPRTVNLPQAEPIREEYRETFLASVTPIIEELLQYKQTQVAPLSSE